MEIRAIDDAATWDGMVIGHPYAHPLQCWGWGEVKRHAGWRPHRLALFDGATMRACAQVLTRQIPGMPLAMTYAPRGPVVTPDDSEGLQALARGLQQHAREQHAIFCKVDPAWFADTPNALTAAGFAPSIENVQVTETYTIDLAQGEDAILANMRSKTRQYIRKAEREETEIVRDTTGEYLSACYTMYEQTAQRAVFGLHPRDYYEHLFAYYPADRQYLYVALRQGTPLSFLWMVCAGRQAVEFYGGVGDAGQNYKSNYLLKWHAIQQMKADGYTIYDLNGRVNEGISQFKQGFGPAETCWVGPYDAVYHPMLYAAWSRGLPLAKRLARRAG